MLTIWHQCYKFSSSDLPQPWRQHRDSLWRYGYIACMLSSASSPASWWSNPGYPAIVYIFIHSILPVVCTLLLRQAWQSLDICSAHYGTWSGLLPGGNSDSTDFLVRMTLMCLQSWSQHMWTDLQHIYQLPQAWVRGELVARQRPAYPLDPMRGLTPLCLTQAKESTISPDRQLVILAGFRWIK